jgi:hypothetical protein
LKPYIGITGVMTLREMEYLAGLADTHIPEHGSMMCGVLMSHKTLNGKPAGNPRRYPPRERICRMFMEHPKFLNLVHYNSREPDILEQLEEALKWVGPYCHGFQLNVAWPDHLDLVDFKQRHPDKVIVLQLSARVLAEIEVYTNYTGLLRYSGGIDAVLIDASGGQGEALDVDRVVSLRRRIDDEFPLRNVSVGVAGGLDRYSVDVVRELRKSQPAWETNPVFSIDAEGRLRTALDALDLDAVTEYVRELAPVLFARA